MSQPMIVSWCPGDKCDPCAPTLITYHLYIIGSTYNQPTPLVYLSYYASEPISTPVTVSGTIKVTAESVAPSHNPLSQSFSLPVSATGYVQAGANALSTPLPATDTGILVDMYTTVSPIAADGPVIVQGALAPSLYYVPPFTTWTKPKTH